MVSIPKLMEGVNVPMVRRWQRFLRAQGVDAPLSGTFDQPTREATRAFQQRNGLEADGIAGNKTLGLAMSRGFVGIENPGDMLRQGAKGSFAERWQQFLREQVNANLGVDGDFGQNTHNATVAFQQKHGLEAHGIVSNLSLGKAMTLGFKVVGDPAVPQPRPGPVPTPPPRDPNYWPPLPPFPYLDDPTTVFGRFRHRHAPVPSNPERIEMLDNWEATNIVIVTIPQLQRLGVAGGRVQFHRRAAQQFVRLWAAWEAAGLLDRVIMWGGSYVPRYIRGRIGILSRHAYGAAFDINVAQNGLGAMPARVGSPGSVRELVPIAHQHGFYWGGHFESRPDGMHFEVARLV